MTWQNGQKYKVFDNKIVLEKYCQDYATVLKQACQIFRREFDIGYIEGFLESFAIASACNKVLRKQFLKPDTIGLIPNGYCCNNNYRMKALMWLVHMLQTEAVG